MRVERTVNGTATTYLQDLAAGLPVVLRETTSGTSTDYVYGVDIVTTIDSGSAPTFYHGDGLGSTRLLTDETGNIIDQYTYDAFGAERAHTGGSDNPFTYAGEQTDPEAGLIFLRARYYDPDIGRFLSRDIFPSLARDTQTLHRYIYVKNNPVRVIDPSGMAWWDFLDAEKNGINQLVRNAWNNTGVGDYVVENTPLLNGLVDTAEGMDQYALNYRRQLDLITPDMTEEDQKAFDAAEVAAMQGLQQGLSSASDTAMNASCTSFNPGCGLSDFLPNLVPKTLGNLIKFVKNPVKFLLNQMKGAIVDPIYDIPSLYIFTFR